MRLVIMVFVWVMLYCTAIARQVDTTQNTYPVANVAADTAMVTQTLPLADTLPVAIRMPDSLRHNQYIDTLLKQYAFNAFNFHSLRQQQLQMGRERTHRAGWVIGIILFLLVYTGLLNRLIGKDILNVIEGFYIKRSLAKLTREDNLLTSWAYICLFILFGLIIGLYIYQLAWYYNITYTISGIQLYFACSLLVIAVFLFKILIVRVLGFIFDIQRLVGEYVSILYLTYFNIAFIFLPVVICFSLFASALIHFLVVFSVVLILVIFLVQYLRSALNIISTFTFPKIYLFVYLCALEICPVLILIKALNL